ncbi:M48 family metalloprotease [Thermococcus sp.]|uniref:M48 family metallopeptidase n=1 Tax=Thermococcus sp. TaxID=35749 RepID=UPI00260288FF|nr:M48 family metalloprotease [Thermococcus sp.]
MLYALIPLEVILILYALGRSGLTLILGVSFTLVVLYLWSSRHRFGDGLMPLERREFPWLYDGIAKLAERAGIGMPKVYLLDDYIPNAYSFGNTIVLSLGLFEVLDRDEILAVAAHELGHIKNGDTILFPLITYGRYLFAVTTLTLLLLGSNIVKFLALLLYIGYEVERSSFMKGREFKADETALRLLRVPLSLRKALEELKYYEDLRETVKVSGVPSIEPSIERERKFTFIPETHPTYEERIWRITYEMNQLANRNLQ